MGLEKATGLHTRVDAQASYDSNHRVAFDELNISFRFSQEAQLTHLVLHATNGPRCMIHNSIGLMLSTFMFLIVNKFYCARAQN